MMRLNILSTNGKSLRRGLFSLATVLASGCALEPSDALESGDGSAPIGTTIETQTEADAGANVARLGQPISLCGPETALPDAPTLDGLHTGYVDFGSAHPWLDGFSFKPERSNELEPASPGRHPADGVYSLNWSGKKPLKIGGLCVAHVRSDRSLSCCCSAVGALKGGCQDVSPGAGDERAWPQKPLGTPSGSDPTGAQLSSSWSANMPNLRDGTYKCGNTHADAAGKSFVQDCTRAVKGGLWQTVSIYTNKSNHTADLRMATSAVRNGVYIGTITCVGTIPNNASRACWGKTQQNANGTIQTLNRGGKVGVYSGSGGLIVLPRAFSPSRLIVP